MSLELDKCVEIAEGHGGKLLLAYVAGDLDEASKLWRGWYEFVNFLPTSYKEKVTEAFFDAYCEIGPDDEHLVRHNGFQEKSCKQRRESW